MIKERISYVIPIAVSDDSSGLPVLVYEIDKWKELADLSFGVFFIGLRANKPYAVLLDIGTEDGTHSLIPFDSKVFANRKTFRVSPAADGEMIVSASIKVIFDAVSVKTPGVYVAKALLIDLETNSALDEAKCYFDIKPVGIIRDEFR